MIDLFARHTPPTIDTLQQALRRGDWPAVKAAAHTLKSSSRGLGAERLAAILMVLDARESQGAG